MTKKRKLNLRQELFADWYIKLGNATEAAKRAGYSERTAYAIGSKQLKKVEVLAYIRERKKELEDLLGINKATVVQDFITIKNKSMQAEPVMVYSPKDKAYKQVTEVNDKGKEVGVYSYDSQGANRALENIAKIMGYNEPEKLEVKTPIQVNVNFNWPKVGQNEQRTSKS